MSGTAFMKASYSVEDRHTRIRQQIASTPTRTRTTTNLRISRRAHGRACRSPGPHLEHSTLRENQLVGEVVADQEAGDGIDEVPNQVRPTVRVRDPRDQGRGIDEGIGHEHRVVGGRRIEGSRWPARTP